MSAERPEFRDPVLAEWAANIPELTEGQARSAETRPLTKREERRFSRKAARDYVHMTPWRNCNEILRGVCLRCWWRRLNGTQRKELAALRDRLRR